MNILLILALAAGGIYAVNKRNNVPENKGTEKRIPQKLIFFERDMLKRIRFQGYTEQDHSEWSYKVGLMNDNEIDNLYVFITQYYQKGRQIPKDNPLNASIAAIIHKYGIYINNAPASADKKRDWLKNDPSNTKGESPEGIKHWRDTIDQMSDAEINDVYEFITQYFLKGKQLKKEIPLHDRIMAISKKYNVFT